MINLKITMIDGSEIFLKNRSATSAIEFVRFMMKPGGVRAQWVEIISGTVINTDNIRSIQEISESEIPTAEDMIIDDVIVMPGEKENQEITPDGEEIEDKAEKDQIPKPAQVA